jgi:hypothetical protein
MTAGSHAIWQNQFWFELRPASDLPASNIGGTRSSGEPTCISTVERDLTDAIRVLHRMDTKLLNIPVST